jgi:glycosyltransferase involved in cell wall biosynthesis
MTWRGGENQVRILAEGLESSTHQNFIAYPKGSKAIRYFSKSFPSFKLHSRIPWDPFNLFPICSFIDQQGIQILDAHSSKAHSLALYIKKLRPDLKLVVHRRVDTPASKHGEKKYRNRSVDRIVAISYFIANMMKEIGVCENKIRVIRSAVPAQQEYTPAKSQQKMLQDLSRKIEALPEETVILGSASALDPQKGVDILLEALSKLSQQSNYHLFIAGTGKSEGFLKKLVVDKRLEKQVSFLGFVENVRSLLKQCHIQIAASRNEGLGTVILEGALSGCALIGTRVGGIPEIIKDKQTGLLVRPEDPESLATALDELIQSKDLQQRLSNNARAYVLENFSSEKMIQENKRLYDELS